MTEVLWPTVLEKGSWSGEMRFRHFKTGDPIPILYSCFRIDDPETGQPVNVGNVCRDITKRKRAEAEAREKDRRYREMQMELAHANRVATVGKITARSFSARAAHRCSRNGSTSEPRSATRNGVLCAIKPLMKCTSRESLSSFETATGHALPLRRASARAAASCGRRSRASAPLPVSISTRSSTVSNPRPRRTGRRPRVGRKSFYEDALRGSPPCPSHWSPTTGSAPRTGPLRAWP